MEAATNIAPGVLILQKELAKRCARNSSYSLRSFALALGISHTYLSYILSGKRPLSRKLATKVAERLGVPFRERQLLLAGTSHSVAHKPLSEKDTWDIDLETFSLLSQWQHFAILNILKLPRYRFEARWIAKRLGISIMDAKFSMDRLKRLNLVKQVNGTWKRTALPIRFDNEKSVSVTRQFHSGIFS